MRSMHFQKPKKLSSSKRRIYSRKRKFPQCTSNFQEIELKLLTEIMMADLSIPNAVRTTWFENKEKMIQELDE
jgi:hypothetical protein